MKLILASSSQNRQNIFKMLGVKYEVVTSNVEEESGKTNSWEYVQDLARDKAHSVAEQISGPAIIVSADSVVDVDGKIFEKPKTKEQAFENMKKMSGRMVKLVTGTTIMDLYKNQEVTYYDIAEVYFKKATDEDIMWYVNNEPRVLCGCGFTIPGKAEVFVDKIVGDFNTVFGISPSLVNEKLHELGYSLNDFEKAE